MSFPSKIEIPTWTASVDGVIRPPGSKSISNRALVLAALTAPPEGCLLRGLLHSEDTEVMFDGLRKLGIRCERDDVAGTATIYPGQTLIPAREADLYVANSGTTMRFLTAMLALGRGRYRLDGVPRMRERPIQDLLDALQQLGVSAKCVAGNGCPPVVLEANGLPGGDITIRGDVSSQFLSGLLMAAPKAADDVTICVDGPLVSIPYIDMTLAMIRQFGLTVENHEHRKYIIPGRQRGGVPLYHIEPDASAASYWFALAAITGGRVVVEGIGSNSLQGDIRFAQLMGRMGCQVHERADHITVDGGPLVGIDVDMNDISDTVMTLGAVACFANGPTTVRNVGHIRHKETDRLAALAAELRKVGAEVEECEDGLTIVPRPLHGASIETYNDHRMAMSLALVGVKTPGVVIENPGCVAKTYPRFFEDLERLRR